MSSIIARAAFRSTLARNAVPANRRQLSLMNSMRSFARSFEPHVFQRLPVTESAQAPDYSRLFKRITGTFILYVPVSLAILGWPVAAEAFLDGHII